MAIFSLVFYSYFISALWVLLIQGIATWVWSLGSGAELGLIPQTSQQQTGDCSGWAADPPRNWTGIQVGCLLASSGLPIQPKLQFGDSEILRCKEGRVGGASAGVLSSSFAAVFTLPLACGLNQVLESLQILGGILNGLCVSRRHFLEGQFGWLSLLFQSLNPWKSVLEASSVIPCMVSV